MLGARQTTQPSKPNVNGIRFDQFGCLNQIRMLAVPAFLALAGCASPTFFSPQLSVPFTDLNERISQRFPMERSIADLLTVTLMRPKIAPILAVAERGPTMPAARLSLTLDLQLKLPSLVNATQRTLWGSMTLSGVPRYEPKLKGIVLLDAKLDRVRVDNMPNALSAALAKTASQLAKEHLDNKPIYSLTAAQVTRLGLEAENSALSFVVLADRLVIAKQ